MNNQILVNPKGDKLPPKKFHPKGTTILYEDRDIIVLSKRGGLLTISSGKAQEKTLYSLLTDYVKKGNSRSNNRVFIVHRLDRDTSGLLIFAKSFKAKENLQSNWATFTKKYLAITSKVITPKEGEFSSYLTENSVHKVFSTSNKEIGKFSKTLYRTIKSSKRHSLVEITLMTGRKNQIRVHFSEAGFPILGDKKYGEKIRGSVHLSLHSYQLTFLHPTKNEWMLFSTEIPKDFSIR